MKSLRKVLNEAVEKSGKSLSEIARQSGVDKGNLSKFLRGRGRSPQVGLRKLERIFHVLDVRVSAPKYPPHLRWMNEVDRWQVILAPRLPDVPIEDIRQILIYSCRPLEERLHFIRQVGPYRIL